MTKHKGTPDFMRYIPLAVMAVSLVSGWATLKAQASTHDDKIKAIEVVQAQLSADSSAIKVSQAKTEATLNAVYELVKDLKKK